jgi:uncharacterized membrane-anchored protein
MDHKTRSAQSTTLNKVPQVTLAVWVIKILATTPGAIGSDALSGK